MARFDHLAISATDLSIGAEAIASVLGVPLEPGGAHPFMGTHNRLLSLGPGEYLELIAIDPAAPAPGHPRWFRLDTFAGAPRLTNWIVRVDDLDAALSGAVPGSGRPVDLERGAYRWRMAIPSDGCLPFDDCHPALIAWQGDLHPADALPDRGCRLTALKITHPEADGLRAVLPLDDPRVTVTEGAPGLRAMISTPHGLRVLA